MAVYHGKTGSCYLSTSATGTAVALTHLTSWSLNMPTDKIETTTFGNDNKRYAQGFADVSGTLAGFWDDTNDNLYDACQSSNGAKVYLYPTTLVLTQCWYGLAWLDMSIETSATDAVKYTARFVGKGDWGWRDVLLLDLYEDARAAGSVHGTLATDQVNPRSVTDTDSLLSIV